MKRIAKYEIYLLLIFYLIGFLGHNFAFSLNIFLSLTPYFLFFTSLYVLIRTFRKKKDYILLSLILLSAFFIEVLGVNTGFVFGHYAYGKTLGLKLFSTPVIIGINWIMIVFGSLSLVNRVIDKKIPASIICGVLVTYTDVIIEPMAVNYDWWRWRGEAVPFQNYLAWFIISASIAFFSFNFIKDKKTNLLSDYFLIQLIFFIFMYSFLK